MNNLQPVDSPTIRLHKRQFVWQILLPILLVILLGLAVGGLTITASLANASNASLWADVSIIWLLIPALVFALVAIAILGFAIYGLAKVLQVAPTYTGKAQGIFALISALIRKVADGLTKPFVWFHQAGTVLKSIFKS